MSFYDSNKIYENEKEKVFIRSIIPISSSHFRNLELIEYDKDTNVFKIVGDGLDIMLSKDKSICKKKSNKLTEREKVLLKTIKNMYIKWEVYK